MIMEIPVLMYHEIYKTGKTDDRHPYAVSEEMFEKQLQYLKANNYQTLLIEDSKEQNGNGDMNSSKQIIITFDDTQVSNYMAALPLLKRYGFEAHYFISTFFVNKGKNFLNENQIREMSQKGMSIQSHTHTHAFLDDLDEDQMYAELKTSKTILEEIVKKDITLLSCPGGRFNKVLLGVAKEIGYKGVFTSIPGIKLTGNGIDVYGRFLISKDTDMQTFEQIIRMDRSYLLKKKLESSIKNSVKKIIGNKLYHNFWKRVKGDSVNR